MSYSMVAAHLPITIYQLPNGLIRVRRRWGQRHPQGANSDAECGGLLVLLLVLLRASCRCCSGSCCVTGRSVFKTVSTCSFPNVTVSERK
jgi:hypothetical protein